MTPDTPTRYPMDEGQPRETPIADLRRNTLAHYEKVSLAAHEWHSIIPQAINRYFDERERLAALPPARPAEPTSEEPKQPTMEALRAIRDAVRENGRLTARCVEVIATLDAQNVGYPTLEDADMPEVHRDFAREVLSALLDAAHLDTKQRSSALIALEGDCHVSAGASKPHEDAVHDALCKALQRSWNDYCTDTGCHPDVLAVRARELTANFMRGDGFTRLAAQWLGPALAEVGLAVRAVPEASADGPIAPDHPEGTCEDCGGPNVSWFAPSSLWNRVVRPDGEQGADPMLCPRCFALRAHRAGVVATWLLRTDEDVGPVRMCPDCGQPMRPARKGEDIYLCGNLACVPREDLPIDNATLRAKIIADPDEPDCFTGPPSTMVEMEWDSAAGMTRYRVVAGHASAEPMRTIEQLTHDIEAFGAGAGAAEPESAEQLAWIEKAKAARATLMVTVESLLSAPLPPGEPTSEAVAWDKGKVWSFIRTPIEQGRAIQQDDAAGKYATYEHLAARVDQAARERVAEFVAKFAHPLPSDAPVDLSAVEAAIDKLCGYAYEDGRERRNYDSVDTTECRESLLSLYRTALSGEPSCEAAMWREVEKRASRETRFMGHQVTRFTLHFDGDVQSIAEGLEQLGLVPPTRSGVPAKEAGETR